MYIQDIYTVIYRVNVTSEALFKGKRGNKQTKVDCENFCM